MLFSLIIAFSVNENKFELKVYKDFLKNNFLSLREVDGERIVVIPENNN